MEVKMAISKSDLLSHLFIHRYEYVHKIRAKSKKSGIKEYAYLMNEIHFRYGYKRFYRKQISQAQWNKMIVFLPLSKINYETIDDKTIAIHISDVAKFFTFLREQGILNQKHFDRVVNKFNEVFNEPEYKRERAKYGIQL